MFDLTQHLAKARPLPDLAPDVAYSVQPSLFYGSVRKAQPNDLRDKSVALYNPRFTQKQQVLGLAVEGHEKELLHYYTDVLKAAQQHRKDLNAIRHYFWLRPVLRSQGRTIVTFPWHDAYPDAASFLQALQNPADDAQLFSDIDQGWQLELYALGDKLYIAEGDGDSEKPHAVYHTGRQRMATLAADVLARTQQQLALLTRETGVNPWRYQ